MDQQERKIATDKMYTMYDLKSETYRPPFVAKNHAVAIRLVIESGQQGMPWGQYPEDFVCFMCGWWDEHDGVQTGSPLMEVVRCGQLDELKRAVADGPSA